MKGAIGAIKVVTAIKTDINKSKSTNGSIIPKRVRNNALTIITEELMALVNSAPLGRAPLNVFVMWTFESQRYSKPVYPYWFLQTQSTPRRATQS